MSLELNCLVLGDHSDRIFTIEIPQTESVNILKTTIKQRKSPAFNHVPAYCLDIFKVSFPIDDGWKAKVSNHVFKTEDMLSDVEELSDIFSVAPARKHLHIIVRCPVPKIPPFVSRSPADNVRLNCLVLGDDANRVFPVKIATIESVGDLKVAIKQQKSPVFDDIPADCLDIFKVSFPVDDGLEVNISNHAFKAEDRLSPVHYLSRIFSVAPAPEHLHIIVCCTAPKKPSQLHGPSSTHNLAALREEWSRKFPIQAPSQSGNPNDFAAQQEKEAFYFCRPPSADATMPITLYNVIFAQFQDDCRTYTPKKEDYDIALRLSHSMSKFYKIEDWRAQQFRDDLGAEYGLELELSANEIHGYRTDKNFPYGSEFCCALLEVKSELCWGNAEPLFEAAGHYVALTEKRNRELQTVNSHLPCFILYLAGAHIGFAGAIWTSRPHLQVLAPMLPLFHHATDVNMRMQIARHLGATKKAVLALKSYYAELSKLARQPTPNPLFPHPQEYLCLESSKPCTFTYLSQLQPDKLLFKAIANTNTNADGNKLCIKFVNRYSKEAHLMCSSLGFAPTLRGFQPIPGGWYMVVMDYLDDAYHNLTYSRTMASFEPVIRDAVTKLHQAGFVHGDIRDINIMVKEGSSGIMLVDFDWAGVIGEVRYPMNVENRAIRRPAGAEDGELIMAEHDIMMVDFMFEFAGRS